MREAIKEQFAKFWKEFELLSEADKDSMMPVLRRLERYSNQFIDFEEKAKKELAQFNPEAIPRLQGELIALLDSFDRDLRVYGEALRTLSGGQGMAFLKGVWGWVSGNVVSRVIRDLAQHLEIRSWSFGVTAGMPSGLSSTITVHFSRK